MSLTAESPRGRSHVNSRDTWARLFLLNGQLWIDDRNLYPGHYNRAEAGSGDKRVWSETGCTYVLVTSTQDKLGS